MEELLSDEVMGKQYQDSTNIKTHLFHISQTQSQDFSLSFNRTKHQEQQAKQTPPFKSSLRLLDSKIISSPPSGCFTKNQRRLNRLGFGTSEERKVSLFQICKEHSQRKLKFQDLSKVVKEAFLKTQGRVQNHSQQGQKKKVHKQQQNRVGFGASSFAPRATNNFKNNYPGPGCYNIAENSRQRQQKDCDLLKEKKKGKQNINLKLQKLLKEERSIGPGSYDLPSFSSASDNIYKEKWKVCLLKQKRKKYRLLQNFGRERDTISPQEKQVNCENIEIKKKNYKLDPFFKGKSQKPLRTLLAEKTNSLIMNPLLASQQFSSQFKGPAYKFLLSNSFQIKNDHPFQAHYYNPPQPQPQFYFIPGRNKPMPLKSESCSFKSSVKRVIF